MNKKCIFVFIILFMFSICLYSDTQFLVYDKVTDIGDFIDSLTFKFKQKIKNDGKETCANGEIFYKAPNNFKVIYKKPNHVDYISDGTQLWIVDRDKKQVLRKNVEDETKFFGREIIEFFRFGDQIKSSYEINSFWEQEKLYGFTFKKIEGKDQKVTVYINNKTYMPKRIVFIQEYVTFEIDIIGIETNMYLEPEIFSYKQIDDINVVEL